MDINALGFVRGTVVESYWIASVRDLSSDCWQFLGTISGVFCAETATNGERGTVSEYERQRKLRLMKALGNIAWWYHCDIKASHYGELLHITGGGTRGKA